MNYILLIASFAMCSFRSIFTKLGKNEFSSGNSHKLNAVSGLISFFLFIVMGYRNLASFSGAIFIYGAMYAIFTISSQLCTIKAISCGNTSVSSLFTYCGFIIPTVFGTVWYREEISAGRIFGIALLIFALILSVEAKGKFSFSFKWLILSISAMICSGIIGIIQKLFRNSPDADNLDAFLICAFALMAVFSFVMYLVEKKKGNIPTNVSNKKFVVLSVLIAITIGLCNKINLFLSGVMPSSVMFPAVNGGSIILTAIMSVYILKEPLSLKQKLAMVLGFVAILIIGIA